MLCPDGTFNIHREIMALAEEFCREWGKRRGFVAGGLERALLLSFAPNTIRRDLDQLLDQLEKWPIFGGISPREVYEQGVYEEEAPPGLSDQDVFDLVEKALQRLRQN